MREMNARSTNKQNNPPKAEKGFVNNTPKQNGNIPILDKINLDSDTTLIIGLLLILMSEKSDKTLLFALMYILM